MASGGYVRYNIWGEPKKVNKNYWLWQAERCFEWSQYEPLMRWETHMYFYLFRWAGYNEHD